MNRETAMRLAFRDAIHRAINVEGPMQQPGLAKSVARVYDGGAGLRQPRPKR